jgi:hypothetical protein
MDNTGVDNNKAQNAIPQPPTNTQLPASEVKTAPTPGSSTGQSRQSAFKEASREAFQESTKTVMKYVFTIGLALIFIVIACFGATFAFRFALNRVGENISDSMPFSGNNSEEEKKEEQRFNKPEKKNESVIVGQVEWKLTETLQTRDSLKSGTDDETYCKPTEDTKYVIITYSVRNVDRPFVTVPKDSVDLYDGDESKYSPSTKLYKCVLGTENMGDRYVPDVLKRDEKKEYKALYEVPKNAKGFRMKVGDLSVVGKEFEYIGLGF